MGSGACSRTVGKTDGAAPRRTGSGGCLPPAATSDDAGMPRAMGPDPSVAREQAGKQAGRQASRQIATATHRFTSSGQPPAQTWPRPPPPPPHTHTHTRTRDRTPTPAHRPSSSHRSFHATARRHDQHEPPTDPIDRALHKYMLIRRLSSRKGRSIGGAGNVCVACGGSRLYSGHYELCTPTIGVDHRTCRACMVVENTRLERAPSTQAWRCVSRLQSCVYIFHG